MRSLKIEILGAWQNIVFTKISLTQLIESLMTILRGDQRNQSLDFSTLMSSGVRPHFQLLELENSRRLEKIQKVKQIRKKDHQKDNGLKKDQMKLVEI